MSTKKAIFKLVENNKLNEIGKLINEGLDVNMVRNERSDHTNLLDVAVKYASLSMVKLLVKYGAKSFNTRGIEGIVLRRDEETIKILTYYFPRFQEWAYEKFSSYLSYVEAKEEAKKFIKDIIYFNYSCSPRDLIDQINSYSLNSHPRAFLELYTFHSHATLEFAGYSYDLVKYLLGLGIQDNYPKIYSSLSSASYYGNVKAVKLLLENGANPNAQSLSSFGFPLESGVKSNSYEITKLLLKNGANISEDFKSLLLKYPILKYKRVTKECTEEEKEQSKSAFNLISLLLESNSPIEIEDKGKVVSAISFVEHYEVLQLFKPYLDSLPEYSYELYHEKAYPLLLEFNN